MKRRAAGALGHQLLVLTASTERELDTAFATLVQHQAGALIVSGDPFLTNRRDQLVALGPR